MKKVLKSLGNPFVLSAQGFILGAFLFFGTQHAPGEAVPQPGISASTLLDAARAQL